LNFAITDEQLEADTYLVGVEGEIDLYSAPELKRRLAKAIDSGQTRLVVDLGRATFIDSTTLGVLIAAVKRVRPVGGTLAIVCADSNITRIFELTGLDKVFPIRGSREEAIAATA
jgi:anti-sigma B factor antagonist